MQKLDPKSDGRTTDFVAENIDKMKQMFPEIITEDGIDFETLRELLGDYVDDKEERYEFKWHGKSRARWIAQSPSMGTLRPSTEESVNWDNTQNLFIEGDNLEALKLLQKSYHKKVKMIYIDPPYNTGNEFIYPDKYQDNLDTYLRYTGQVDDEGFKMSTNSETAGRYHTNWLNMIYPRLKLARNLMSDDGIIFISIDDHEIENLKKICNEIFGEDNFVELFIVRSNPRGNQAKKYTASEHEYIMCYAKNIMNIDVLGFAKSENEYRLHDEIGLYRELGLRKRGAGARREDAPNQYFPIYYNPSTEDIEIEKKSDSFVEILPKLSDGTDGRWRWSKKSVSERKDELLVRPVKRKGKSEYDVFQKDYFLETKKSKIKSIIYKKEVNYENGTEELKYLFENKKYFNYPKPAYLIQHIFSSIDLSNDIILDFFAGSCTTAHAVLDLNKEDNGNCKFIMVQLPEPCDEKSEAYKTGYETIADIGKERIRRVANKIKEENPEYQGDLGFKVFKLDSTNIKPWEIDADNLQSSLEDYVSNIKDGRSEEDVLYEILIKYGLDLTLPIEERVIQGRKVFVIGYGALVICLDDDITLESVEGIAKLKDELQPEVMRIVFKDNGFKDDVVKTNAVQILGQSGIEDVKSL
jgi:adenine-specific DNA-methyltransferase